MENIIKEIRRRNNLTQVEFAKKIGVSRSAVALIETGVNNISQELFQKIQNNFTLTTQELEVLENVGVNMGFNVGVSNNTSNNNDNFYHDVLDKESDFLIASYEELNNIEEYLQVICKTLFIHTSYEFTEEEVEKLNKLKEISGLVFDLMFDKVSYTKEHVKLIKSSIALSKELLEVYITELKYTMSGSVTNYEQLLIEEIK